MKNIEPVLYTFSALKIRGLSEDEILIMGSVVFRSSSGGDGAKKEALKFLVSLILYFA